MCRLKQWLCVVVVLLVVAGPSVTYACDFRQQAIRIALFDFAPYYSLDDDGLAAGELITKVDKVLAKAGCHWQGTFYTAPDLLEHMINGYVDMVVIVAHPLMAERSRYIDPPIDQWHVFNYQKQGRSAATSLKQLEGQTVIALRGYGYGGLFRQLIEPERQIKLLIAENLRHGLQLLETNPNAHLLSYRYVTEPVIEAMGLQAIQASHIDSINVYMMLSPKLSESALAAELEMALVELYKQQQLPQRSAW